MEDQFFSSLCKAPVSYYTLAEQRDGSTQQESRQRKVSHDGNTYICMIVSIPAGHWVAVQITVAPFSLEKFPDQIFFSSKLRYGPCCSAVDHEETSNVVRNAVQRAIDSSYRAVCWNYSSSYHCIVDHPTNTDIEQCVTIVNSRFLAYTEPRVEDYEPSSQSNQNTLDGRRYSTDQALPSSLGLKRKSRTEPNEKLITAPPLETQLILERRKEQHLVQSTALWLKDELKNLSMKTFSRLNTLSDISLSQPKDEACTLAHHLWVLSNEVQDESAAVVWSMRYLATCASVIGTVLTTTSTVVTDLKRASNLLSLDKVSKRTIYNWQGLVRIVNTLVDMMLLKWENKAYLIYYAFAAKGCLLSSVARMSDVRQEKFALGVANALELIAPSGFEGVELFNPARLLSFMLPTKGYEEICKAMWLPRAINSGTTEDEGSILQIPNIAALSDRVKYLSSLPARLRSESTPGLSPRPAPPTCQQAHSTGVTSDNESAQVGDLPLSYRLTYGTVSLAQNPIEVSVDVNLAIASTLCPPQALLVSEELFHSVKVYFEDSCRKINLDACGTLITPTGMELRNDLCNDFDSYCYTATMLAKKGLHVPFRHTISKASALVERILEAEHPRTLACFLEVFIHLRQTELPSVTSFLLRFIKTMSANVTRRGHPLCQICRLLDEIGPESLDQAMALTWKCITDTFDSILGILHPLAVSVRLDYIKRVYGITNHAEEEWLLRDLLTRLGGIPQIPTPRVMLNLAHNLSKQGRHDEAECMALAVLSLLQDHEMYAKRIVERIESRKIVCRSQFNRGKVLEAEQTMRQAIQLIVDQWGMHHSWVLEFKNVLEGWLRWYGREEDANKLREEIEFLIGKDDIDEIG
ncbi:uncharacterized protein RAG0_02805 [Rhynchosporium agropyri]|uniref:Uncharacterized protein n=1 Tax=Rhynchosporium agropyri TaxID=914238 RepID=A0A1E1K307_9HELO|nr:uncharacterized protein RAG0_02805 [Rhynchosporium agropyri]